MQPLPPPQYGQDPAPVVLSGKPSNNLILAIFSTLCCCVPTGIAAIVYAAQVDGKWNNGDYAGAQQAAEESKKWSYISIVVGLVVSVAWVAFSFATGSASGMGG